MTFMICIIWCLGRNVSIPRRADVERGIYRHWREVPKELC